VSDSLGFARIARSRKLQGGTASVPSHFFSFLVHRVISKRHTAVGQLGASCLGSSLRARVDGSCLQLLPGR
jgi:hypothetical protein